MSRATKAQYKKAARLYFSGKFNQAQACVKAKVYTNLETADSNCYKIFNPETGNAYLLEELERLRAIEFDESVMSKKEKLETNALLSRGVTDRIKRTLDDDEAEIDHKLIDSFVKLGKRDDVLQGHQIMAETNPQDKEDAMIAGWLMESHKINEEKRIKDADVIDV